VIAAGYGPPAIIGYLLIGTDNTARKQVEAEQRNLDQRLRDQQFYMRPPTESNIDALMTTDASGVIVDDNEDSARSLAMLQSRRNYETLIAFTGPAAVAVAAEFAGEVVLLDIGLPGMDGFEVACRLRAMPALDGAFPRGHERLRQR